mmetsp:Transcript_114554/g.255636  ORF Transcript_114554/g.255636 Transcript_114554/m.255636 type:complete len:128 (+) Transcript_114554:240-623(+)
MDDFKDHPSALIADVDCTAEGKDLCEKHGVQGFPTIKYGDPTDLQDYQGGRDYESLKQFADENLGPQCGPAHLDLCPADLKKKIEAYMQMSADKLEAKVSKAKKTVEEDVPLMQKALAHLKSTKADL